MRNSWGLRSGNFLGWFNLPNNELVRVQEKYFLYEIEEIKILDGIFLGNIVAYLNMQQSYIPMFLLAEILQGDG